MKCPAPGRRHRPSARCNSTDVADVKAKFTASVNRAVTVLMEQCGYSRDRATAALLREIVRGDTTPPTDEEIFDTMNVHGLGIEGASRALSVSRALQREITQRNLSVVEAIEELTAKLSVANLVKNCESSSPTQSSRRADVSIQPPIQSEVRIQPRLRAKPTTSTAAALTAAAKKAKPSANKNAKQKSKASATPNTTKNSNARKRPLEDTNQSDLKDSKPQFRQRSDSLSEVVNAKFAENSTKLSDDETNIPAVAAAVRTKRNRAEEGTDAGHVTKRPRAAASQPKGSTEL